MNFESITKKKNGFAILYSVLIASILLAIGLAILNITIKELLFSSLGRESQFAFYASDTGVECALYWDFKANAFATSSPLENIDCGGGNRDVTVDDSESGSGLYKRIFQINFAPEPYCTIVSVSKFESPVGTVIESRGYNTCDTSNSRRVERAIRVTY